MSNNPYDPPLQSSSRLLDMRTAGGAIVLGVCLVMVLPVAVLWDLAAGLVPQVVPQAPMGNVAFNVIYTLFIFSVSAAAVPVGIVGLRSTRWRVALLVLLTGTGETALIYFIKFHPWIIREFVSP